MESKVFLVLSICCTFIFSSSECCAAYRAGAGENSKPNTSYPGAFPVGYPLAATVPTLPPPTFPPSNSYGLVSVLCVKAGFYSIL